MITMTTTCTPPYHNQLDNIKNANVTYYKQQIQQYLGEYGISTPAKQASIQHRRLSMEEIIYIDQHIFPCQDQCKYRNSCQNNAKSNYCQQTNTDGS